MISRPVGGGSAVSAGLVLALFASLSLAAGRAGAAQSGCSVSTFTSSDAPKAIPDPGTAEAPLLVPAGDAVAAVAVRLTVTHPFDSDLRLELVSPVGRAVTLAEAVGMWGHDFTSTVFDDAGASSILSQLPPFTGSFRPAEPLSAFVGSARGGTWTLRVTDLRARYAGQLESWGLDITSCAIPPTPAPKAVGAPAPLPLPTGVPTGRIPVEGRLITVNTNADEEDGSTATVTQLLANPGADGTISLREAVRATNNDPGTYTIRFAPALAGKSIDIGDSLGLPPLTGGGVLIDGDIDGDGKPDVSITDRSTDGGTCGFTVLSGENRLHALSVQGFPCGILLSTPFTAGGPVASHKTLARNVVTGMEVRSKDLSGSGLAKGINIADGYGHPECYNTPCDTHNTWTDTRFVGNHIESDRAIEAMLTGTVGSAIQRITVAGNDIRIGAPDSTRNASAVTLTAGWPGNSGGGGGSDNQISDALVAYNTVEAAGSSYAISAAAGSGCGSNNLVEDLGIVANRVQISALPPIPEAARGFQFAITDGCPGTLQNNDVVRRVRIVGNVFSGQDDAGVMAGEPCCVGNPSSTLTDVLVADNLIQGIVPPSELNPWGIVVGGHTNVSNVTIDSNTVEQQTTDAGIYHVADLAGGGIAVVGGLGAPVIGPPGTLMSIRNVLVTNNRIDTDLAGVTLLGGGPSDEDPPTDVTERHSLSDVLLRGNVIGRVPVLATRWDPAVKGISLIGGLGSTPPATPPWWRETTRCSVTEIRLAGNLVAGVVDDVSVIANFGQGASGNEAALGRLEPITVGARPRRPVAVTRPVRAAAPFSPGPPRISDPLASDRSPADR
jgi:subtilisin-like proprotein convertase family protein